MLRGDLLFQLFVTDNATLFSIYQKHSSRLQASFAEDPFRWDVENAGFGRKDDLIVFGYAIP
jgi:hypothetical protein